MEESYLWKSGIAQYEMRLLLEGALVLYEDGASTLLRLAMKNEQYEAADALEALGFALSALRESMSVSCRRRTELRLCTKQRTLSECKKTVV